MTRRPRLTRERIEGLAVLAEHARSRASRRSGSLLGFRGKDAARARAAIRYIEMLEAWAKGKDA